jgi:hypothetical protein
VTDSGGSALDSLYWRAEILQALYWMRGEGLAEEVAPVALAEFLVADPGVIERECTSLLADGFLAPVGPAVDGPRYRLTRLGVAEGGRSFHDEFAELIKPAHAECGPGCWCEDPKHAGDPCPSTPTPSPGVKPPTPERPRGR